MPALILLLLSVPLASGEVSVSPDNLTVTNLGVGQSQTFDFKIVVTTENVEDVQILVVGVDPESDAALNEYVSIFPSYFSRVDNSENKTFQVTVTNTGAYPAGTYKGELVLSGLGRTIPVSVTTVSGTYGFVPDKGRIVAIMGRSHTLEKTITVTNNTGVTLTDFDAEMEDTQLFGPSGLDWITVEFEAPYQISPNSSVELSVIISPVSVPTGTHERTLVITARHENITYTAKVEFRITVYGEPLTDNFSASLSSTEVITGQSVTLTASEDVTVYLGDELLGTTTIGSLTFTAPDTPGTYSVNLIKDDTKLASLTLRVYEQRETTVVLSKEVFTIGERVSGQVLSGGEPVAGISVSVSGKSGRTNSNGEFSIDTKGLKPGKRTVYVSDMRSGDVWYSGSSASIELVEPASVEPYVGLVVGAIIVGALWIKREVVRELLVNLSSKIGTGPFE